MSFSFQWPRFSDQFHADAIQMLESALNKGKKPPVIADRIEVVELEMGTQPPELEIRDVGELTMDQFRGIFRLTYSGDAHIVLRTKVQANPLNHKSTEIHNLMGSSRGMLAAKDPLVVPMLLRLSHFKLDSYIVLVVSKQKGITLVFKTDPLQNVDINSTFDSIAVIQKFIQREIEEQLRQMFREDLPGIIHRLSQQWVKARVEADYLAKRPPLVPRPKPFDTASAPDTSFHFPSHMSADPHFPRPKAPSLSGLGRPRTASVRSASSAGRRNAPSVVSSAPAQVPSPPNTEGPTSFPHLEQFDPTYGLRPERLPMKSVFSNFRSLFTPNRGLADLAEEPSEAEDDETGMYEGSNWDDLLSESHFSTAAPPPSESDPEDFVEYESLPAVGGGTVTRPRVIHTQSQVQLGEESSPTTGTPNRGTSSRPSSVPPPSDYTTRIRPSYPLSSSRLSVPYPQHSPYFASATPMYSRSPSFDAMSPQMSSIPPVPPLDPTSPLLRAGSPSSVHTLPSHSTDFTHSVPTPPHPEDSDSDVGIKISRPRRSSFSSFHTMDRFYSGSPPEGHSHMSNEHDPKIILKPSLNTSISRLSTLSHSNHTLSPYTRTVEHYTVRSVPPRESTSSGSASLAERQPVKARRKRTYKLGGKSSRPPDHKKEEHPSRPSTQQMSEFDKSELDRYFRYRDDMDIASHYPDLHSPHTRRHFSSYQSET